LLANLLAIGIIWILILTLPTLQKENSAGFPRYRSPGLSPNLTKKLNFGKTLLKSSFQRIHAQD
jgi:hypothetical protein